MADDLTVEAAQETAREVADQAEAERAALADREAAPNFEGHRPRNCGEHRTVGPHRAWCFDCREWCYPEIPCERCEKPKLEAELERLRKELDKARAGAVDLITELEEAEAAIERARALHVRNANTGDCERCSESDYPDYAVPWPCPTIHALATPDNHTT